MARDAPSTSILAQLATSGLSSAFGNTCTAPIDTVKTRMQVAPALPCGGRPGMLLTAGTVVRTSGVTALWSGLGPSIARGMAYGGIRLGAYGPIRDAMASAAGADGASSSFGLKVAAGITSGGLAAGLTSPLEMLKTKQQAGANGGALRVVRDVVARDGVTGLWRGAAPGVARAAVLTAAQAATYDAGKAYVQSVTGARDGAALQGATAMLTGIVSTTACNPVDVIKTQMIVGGRANGGAKPGVVATARDLWAAAGPRAFMRGWTANYARLGPQTVIVFMMTEQLRKVARLDSF